MIYKYSEIGPMQNSYRQQHVLGDRQGILVALHCSPQKDP